MNSPIHDLAEWTPSFALVLARVGASMVLLPGLGEAVAPALVRIGVALSVTILLMPIVQPIMPPLPDSGLSFAFMMVADVATGLWFGWVARMIVLGLPMGAQFIGFQIGLSNVLQPDPELGAQSSVLGKLFGSAAPLLILVSGLYQLPLTALTGLFELIPPGHFLPLDDGTRTAIQAVGAGFRLALQLASPFVIIAVLWQFAVGLIGRITSHLQIQFVSTAGQIIIGLTALLLMGGGIVLAWHETTALFLTSLPGGG